MKSIDEFGISIKAKPSLDYYATIYHIKKPYIAERQVSIF